MNMQTEGAVAPRWGGFSLRTAALAAVAGLVIGLVLVRAAPWGDDGAAEVAPAPVAASVPARDSAPPMEVAITGGDGLYVTEGQVQAARTGGSDAPTLDTPALTDGAGRYFTAPQPAAVSDPGFGCGERTDRSAC